MSLFESASDAKSSVVLPPKNGAGGSAAKTGDVLGGAQGSIIGNDLSITGDHITIQSEKSLRIDGTLEADIDASEVVIGPQGRVQGTISAENVIAKGYVVGTIRARKVAIQATATIEGDVYHQALSMEGGATFNGRSQKLDEVADPSHDVEQPGFEVAEDH